MLQILIKKNAGNTEKKFLESVAIAPVACETVVAAGGFYPLCKEMETADERKGHREYFGVPL